MTLQPAQLAPTTGIASCQPVPSCQASADVEALREEMTRIMLNIQDMTMSHWMDDDWWDSTKDEDPFADDKV